MKIISAIIFFVFVKHNCADYSYTSLTIEVPLDHFSYTNNLSFPLRYLQNNTFWRHGGPIFFYTGNEMDIELFAQNTGFIWETAPKFGAMIIFAEHRYYGKTLPFQEKSYSDINHLGYLTSTQALADFVFLVDYLQTKNCKLSGEGKKCPVIAFGGSYGGMLAAWMRLKYPYVVDGAVASSAPIFQFQGLTNCNTYSNLVATVFKTSSTSGDCPRNIKKSWSTIRNMTSTKDGMAWLSKEWKLCVPLNKTEDVSQLIDGVVDIFNTVAMINYPYPTEFLAPVPANPVRAMCKKMDGLNLSGQNLLQHLAAAMSVFTNYTGHQKCLNFSGDATQSDGWSFQACSELVMPLCVDKANEMFEAQAWDFKKYADGCLKTYGVRVSRDDLALLEYGGKEADFSNIVFTNGLLDPWSPGGFLNSKIPSVYTILIPEAAHHLDLRAANANDPPTVVSARNYIKNIINTWLHALKEPNK